MLVTLYQILMALPISIGSSRARCRSAGADGCRQLFSARLGLVDHPLIVGQEPTGHKALARRS